MNLDDNDDSAEPRNFISLNDVYDHTEEIELDEELYFMGLEEPTNYKHDVKDRN